MSDHIVNADRCFFIGGRSVVRQTETTDRACVNNSLDAFVAGRLHYIVRAFDVALIHLVRIFAPETIISGAVIDNASAFDCLPERIQISQVSGDELDEKPVQVVETARRTNETTDVVRHVRAELEPDAIREIRFLL